MKRTQRAESVFVSAVSYALLCKSEFLTPEHFLHELIDTPEGRSIVSYFGGNITYLNREIEEYLRKDWETQSPKDTDTLELSYQMSMMLSESERHAASAEKSEVDILHMIQALLAQEDSIARFLLLKYTSDDMTEVLVTAISAYGNELPTPRSPYESNLPSEEDDDLNDEYLGLQNEKESEEQPWRQLVTCLNDSVFLHSVYGREEELERTIQVLCRKEKNNPLHIGEPGVGKTALVRKLAYMIECEQVPERLKGAKIYQMDISSMIAGTSYRGDFEKRIRSVMEGVASEKNSIIYIDEIHNIVGAGAIGEGPLDASNMLKPYLEGGDIRFIGSTTYQEYNRHLRQAKGLTRRFQQIDIPEPSIEETVKILESLKDEYEMHHNVTYAPDVMEYAVHAAAKYINDRFFPDKAIDLIDEAGAYRQIHPQQRKYKEQLIRNKKQVVNKELIDQVIARICKIDTSSLDVNDNEKLVNLSARISSEIYGQDEAVRQVSEAVLMGKAGLLEEGKPIASMLFVGPTGVGKTEVCKVLAKELGISFVRFDMSEYAEKHAVAKLIGTPAGYVGYDDGGLLTDAIRKTPNCVLLLDEIEKAHSDIYNILLQVMDYARLTDNKGNQADFRNVILIMTSNAGAQYAHQASIGFASSVSTGSAMLQSVKKTFKPEFLARLSSTVVFNDMDRQMASLILDKKLRQLSVRLSARKVSMTLTSAAHEFLLERGFTHQLGAREMDRQINSLLNPLLMREILFGSLKNGGVVSVDIDNDHLIIKHIA